MNNNNPKYRKVLVDVAETDKEGNPIPFASLSSGGARTADGLLITQYRNPRLPEPANELEADERRRREHDAQLRREEHRRQKEHEDFVRDIARLVGDKVVDPLIQNFVVPKATEFWETKVVPGGKRLWDTKVLPEGRRLAQRLLRRPDPQAPAPDINEKPDSAGKPAKTRTNQDSAEHIVEASAAAADDEVTSLADVIQLDGYQDRRSA